MNFLKNHIYSIIGSLSLILTILLLNLIVQDKIRWRADLTEDKLYTLSNNTKQIISTLDTPVEIRFYYSRFNNNMPAGLKNYARRVDDLLTEYQQNSPMIKVKRLNPEQRSDAEDSALFDGIQPITTVGTERLYLGLSISCLDKSKNLPHLLPQEESVLEYRLSRAISQVYRGDKPVVGVLSSLPVLGIELTAEMAQRQQKAVPPWVAFQELAEDFELKRVYAQSAVLPKDLDLLVIIHPPKLSEQLVSSIDNFIVSGGDAMIFVDPASMIAAGLLSKKAVKNGIDTSSNLEKLFQTWGINYNPDETVADSEIGRRINQKNIKQLIPTLIDITNENINSQNVVTSKINHLAMVFAGSLKVEKKIESLQTEVLLTSSTESQKIPSAESLTMNHQKILAEFKSDGKRKNLAITLSGKFPSAFGKKTTAKDSTVMIIADSDMLHDQACVAYYDVLGNKVRKMLNDNINFLQNSIEYLTGANQLIGIRSRQTIQRPFTVMEDMEAEADIKFKEQVLDIKTELDNARAELKKIADPTGDKKIITTKEQKEALAKVQLLEATFNSKVREAQNELYDDVVRLQNIVKWICISLMPIIIAVVGIFTALFKNRRSTAK